MDVISFLRFFFTGGRQLGQLGVQQPALGIDRLLLCFGDQPGTLRGKMRLAIAQ
jgi:hypothetical protein